MSFLQFSNVQFKFSGTVEIIYPLKRVLIYIKYDMPELIRHQ
jgi:hypothetical protein